MAHEQPPTGQLQRPPRPTTSTNTTTTTTGIGGTFLRKMHEHAPSTNQLTGFLTLLISGAILLFLAGLTITATVLGLIFFAPLILISSPIWVPIGTLIFFVSAGILSLFGFVVVVVTGISWLYKYFRGFNPPGSDQVDYARSRIADTASLVKDYARGYGGYLHIRVKDAAPGA